MPHCQCLPGPNFGAIWNINNRKECTPKIESCQLTTQKNYFLALSNPKPWFVHTPISVVLSRFGIRNRPNLRWMRQSCSEDISIFDDNVPPLLRHEAEADVLVIWVRRRIIWSEKPMFPYTSPSKWFYLPGSVSVLASFTSFVLEDYYPLLPQQVAPTPSYMASPQPMTLTMSPSTLNWARVLRIGRRKSMNSVRPWLLSKLLKSGSSMSTSPSTMDGTHARLIWKISPMAHCPWCNSSAGVYSYYICCIFQKTCIVRILIFFYKQVCPKVGRWVEGWAVLQKTWFSDY